MPGSSNLIAEAVGFVGREDSTRVLTLARDPAAWWAGIGDRGLARAHEHARCLPERAAVSPDVYAEPVEISERVAARVARDYQRQQASQVIELLRSLDVPLVSSSDAFERVCAAILIEANGDAHRLVDAAGAAEVDWRDVLVSAGLAQEDWPERVDAALA